MKRYLWMQLLVALFLVNSEIGAVVLWITTLYYLLSQKGNLYAKLFHCVTYTAPFYAFSFYGGRERLSLCTLYILSFCICVVFLNCRSIMISKKHVFPMLLTVVAMFGYGISMLFSLDALQMLWDTYHCVVMLVALLTCWFCKNTSIVIDTKKELQTIIQGVCAIAGGLYFQFILYRFANTELGYIFISGGTRYIFNLYISAKSVLSMYLAVGLLFYYIKTLNGAKIKDISILAVLMGAMLINNSRTGLACFTVAAAAYTCMNFKKVIAKLRYVGILMLVLSAGMYILDYFLSTRSALSGVLDDNGRFDIIHEVLAALPQNLLGIGGAVVDYNAVGITVVPHSFFLQVLLQHGILSGVCLCIVILRSIFTTKSDFKYYIILLVCGSFMFAHWQNAVFVIPIFMLCELCNCSCSNRN